jgi:hypothetical protein
MIGRKSPLSSGLNTRNESGVTFPPTTLSPRPQEPSIITRCGKPVSVSMVNITPADATSERTIFCTPTEMDTSEWSKPFSVR